LLRARRLLLLFDVREQCARVRGRSVHVHGDNALASRNVSVVVGVDSAVADARVGRRVVVCGTARAPMFECDREQRLTAMREHVTTTPTSAHRRASGSRRN
jgi:hypothetical protein